MCSQGVSSLGSGELLSFSIHRIYEDRPTRGTRVLVDRLWPRGVARTDAHLDEWLKDVAPSTGLRKWYGHQVERFEEFARRYRDELEVSPAVEAVAHLLELSRSGEVILLTATRDVEHSGAQVLLDHLNSR